MKREKSHITPQTMELAFKGNSRRGRPELRCLKSWKWIWRECRCKQRMHKLEWSVEVRLQCPAQASTRDMNRPSSDAKQVLKGKKLTTWMFDWVIATPNFCFKIGKYPCIWYSSTWLTFCKICSHFFSGPRTRWRNDLYTSRRYCWWFFCEERVWCSLFRYGCTLGRNPSCKVRFKSCTGRPSGQLFAVYRAGDLAFLFASWCITLWCYSSCSCCSQYEAQRKRCFCCWNAWTRYVQPLLLFNLFSF